MTDLAGPARPFAPADLPGHVGHYIGGRRVDSVDGSTCEVLDPVTMMARGAEALSARWVPARD